MIPKTVKIQFVYAGVRRFSKGGFGGLFFELIDGGVPESPEECIFNWKVVKGLGESGSIYEYDAVRSDDTLSIIPRSVKWCGRFNDPRVVQWQAEHEAVLLVKRTKAREKVGKHENALSKFAGPLRQVYQSLRTESERQAFLLRVISHIQR